MGMLFIAVLTVPMLCPTVTFYTNSVLTTRGAAVCLAAILAKSAIGTKYSTFIYTGIALWTMLFINQRTTDAFLANIAPAFIFFCTFRTTFTVNTEYRTCFFAGSATGFTMLYSVYITSTAYAHIAYITFRYAAHIGIMFFTLRTMIALGKSTLGAHPAIGAPSYTLALGAAFAFWTLDFFKAAIAMSAARGTACYTGFALFASPAVNMADKTLFAGFTPIIAHAAPAPAAPWAKLRSVLLTGSAIVVAVLPIMVVVSAIGTNIAYVALNSIYIIMFLAFRAVGAFINGTFKAHFASVAHSEALALGTALTFRTFQIFKAIFTMSAAGRAVCYASIAALGAKVFAVMTFKTFFAIAAPFVGAGFAFAAFGTQIRIVAAYTAIGAVIFLFFCTVKAHMAVFAPAVGTVFADLFTFFAEFNIIVTFIAGGAMQTLVGSAIQAHSASIAYAAGTFVAKITFGAANMAYSAA